MATSAPARGQSAKETEGNTHTKGWNIRRWYFCPCCCQFYGMWVNKGLGKMNSKCWAQGKLQSFTESLPPTDLSLELHKSSLGRLARVGMKQVLPSSPVFWCQVAKPPVGWDPPKPWPPCWGVLQQTRGVLGTALSPETLWETNSQDRVRVTQV